MTDSMIVEAIRSVKSQDVEGTRETLAVGAAAPVANPASVERFQAAMATESVAETTKVDAIPFADQMASAWRTAQADHQGLLHRMRALSEMNGKDGLTAAHLTELQYDVMTLSFQQEIVTKVADKASNAVQTLIKNQ